MKIVWRKKGKVFAPDGSLWWACSGAQLPAVDVINNEIIRVYFGSKDSKGFGRTGRIDLDASHPQRILAIANEPVLDLGELGAFDDCGAVPNGIIAVGGKKFLYYQGFQRTERVPYLTFTGLAIGDGDGKNFKKYSRTPIIDRTDEEPFVRSTPCVLQAEGVFKMWYVSTVKWTKDEHGVHYICVIRYATSENGVSWKTQPQICLEPSLPDEYAVGRPAVVYDGQGYRMWYSIRSFSKLYTIGYAESSDGRAWERMDDRAGISKSESGWDSEMICYPCIVDVKGQRMMFYNGNDRGLSGFGYAILE